MSGKRRCHLCKDVLWGLKGFMKPCKQTCGAMQVIKSLNGLITADKSNESAKEIANLMYDTALLTSGFDVQSPKDYASKVYGMMGMALAPGGSASQSSSHKSDTKAEPLEADQVIEEK
jgi:hypothetical protein